LRFVLQIYRCNVAVFSSSNLRCDFLMQFVLRFALRFSLYFVLRFHAAIIVAILVVFSSRDFALQFSL